MGETRRTYTREFKLEAVRLLETSGRNGHQIEKELGIGERADLPLAGSAEGGGAAGLSGERHSAR